MFCFQKHLNTFEPHRNSKDFPTTFILLQMAKKAKIAVTFPPESKSVYDKVLALSKGKMEPAALVRTAVYYYLQQIELGKVIF